MNVVESAFRGFCPGVRKAMGILAKAKAENESVALTGNLCHNAIVSGRIGAPVFDAKSQDTPDACVVNAHGATQEMLAELDSRGVRVYDATCPNVRRIHDLIKGASGCIVYAGVAGHAERAAVESIFKATKDIRFASCADEVPALFGECVPPTVTFVAQSSFSSESYGLMLSVLSGMTEVEAHDTICADCKRRRESVRELAASCDCVLVVGDEASANANELARTAAAAGRFSRVVLDASRIPSDLCGTVGLISSASSPEDVFAGVAEFVRGM